MADKIDLDENGKSKSTLRHVAEEKLAGPQDAPSRTQRSNP